MPFLIGHAITEMHGTVDAKDFVFYTYTTISTSYQINASVM